MRLSDGPRISEYLSPEGDAAQARYFAHTDRHGCVTATSVPPCGERDELKNAYRFIRDRDRAAYAERVNRAVDADPEPCGIGRGAECCAYLIVGGEGFECGRLIPEILGQVNQRLAAGTMTARRAPLDQFPDCRIFPEREHV